MEYGHAANLWRINLGWRRRDHREPLEQGFKLDVERGDWLSETKAREIEEPAAEEDSVPVKDRRIETVIPYVQDTRNALILDPVFDDGDPELRTRKMASLQSALKRAIQAEFDLEEAELAAEPLPRRQDRRRILLYEASEGGAGVLQRLLSEPEAIQRVAKTALELLHYNPDTGAHLRFGPSSEEECEAACYDCLMTYSNQMDHALLDRTTIRDYLRELAAGTVGPVQGPTEPEEHYGGLYEQCDSELEREWLAYLEERGLNLPSRAQVRISDCGTQADFYYDSHNTAVYIDGPPHDYPSRQNRDRQQELCLEEAGYFVIRFGNTVDWDAVIAEYPSVFGSPS
jgi:very-short-patch-repair endonuclease